MSSKTIGITTTIPVEVLYAAGYTPVDLNNIFITSEDHNKYLEIAESSGFPKSLCSWIKGIYGSVKLNNINQIIGVTEGDCSNSRTLIQLLSSQGIKVTNFSFPFSRNYNDIKDEIDKFIKNLGTDLNEVNRVKHKLDEIRQIVREIDDLTIKGYVNGEENHIAQVSCSDFMGDPDLFKEELLLKIKEYKKRIPDTRGLPIGYIGVPPMTSDIYHFAKSHGARIIFNETQREFAFPRESDSIYKQYQNYTYVYSIDYRISEIKKEIQERGLKGLIHYTQSFCHRALEDIQLKKEIEIPILTIEGDRSRELDERTKLRIETFLDMLKETV